MKTTATEYSQIYDLVIRLALGYPEVQFRLTHEKTVVLNIAKSQSFRDRVSQCFGAEIASNLLELEHQESYLTFTGLFSNPEYSRSSKRWQHCLLNNRHVYCKSISYGIYEGYKTLLMKNKHPLFFVRVDMDPAEVDVNVHPAKTEVRVKNPSLIQTIFASQIARLIKKGSRERFFPVDEPAQKMDLDDGTSRLSTPEEKENIPDYIDGIDNQEKIKSPEDPLTQKPKLYEEPNEQLGFQAPSSQKEKPFSVKREPYPAASPTHSPVESSASESPFDFPRSQVPQEVAPTSSAKGLYHTIGQLQKKYILAQGEDELILIDQHAAHERIRFEEIRSLFYSNKLTTCQLMIPVMMELPPQDGLLLEQHQESWEKLGFVIDHFGGNDYSVKEIPTLLKDKDIAGVIREVLDELATFGNSGKLEVFYNEVFERIACHSAIRAGQELSQREMQALIDQLSGLDLQIYCPHGRPVLVEISLKELDKRFKRIL